MEILFLIISLFCLVYGVFLLIAIDGMRRDALLLFVMAVPFLALSVVWCRMPPTGKTVVLVILSAALVLFLVEGSIILFAIHRAKKSQPAEYLIILGCRVFEDRPCTDLGYRIDAAWAYCKKHPGTIVIASGGQGLNEMYSEAHVIATELRKKAGPELRILTEEKSRTTEENLRFSRALVENENATVGIVTNSYHLCRSMLIARKNGWKDPVPVSAVSKKATLIYSFCRETAALFVYQMKYLLKGK